MNTETLIQAIGYFSTVLILISFLMTSVVKLRLLNLAGSIVFVIFAFLTKSYPTAIMNIGLCIIIASTEESGIHCSSIQLQYCPRTLGPLLTGCWR